MISLLLFSVSYLTPVSNICTDIWVWPDSVCLKFIFGPRIDFAGVSVQPVCRSTRCWFTVSTRNKQHAKGLSSLFPCFLDVRLHFPSALIHLKISALLHYTFYIISFSWWKNNWKYLIFLQSVKNFKLCLFLNKWSITWAVLKFSPLNSYSDLSSAHFFREF